MRRVNPVNGNTIRVQSGVVQADLNRALGQKNLLFGPILRLAVCRRSEACCRSTPRAATFHATGQRRACAVGPSRFGIGRSRRAGAQALGAGPRTTSTAERLASEVGSLLQRNSALLLRPPWSEVARGCGYRVEKTLDGDHVNLARLLCGSEGTLAVITEATLELDPMPKVRGLMLLFFERNRDGARAVLEVVREEIAACDLMDRRLLEIARETEAAYATIGPRGAEAMLLIEMHGDDAATVRDG